MLLGQVNTTGGAVVTVKLATQVLVVSQSEVTVNVTEVVPPQANGAPVLLFVNIGLHPPVSETEASQLLNFVFMVACVWHSNSVVFEGQVKTTGGALVTVNVATQVLGASQSDVTVNVTLVDPPQAGGALPPLLVKTPLQPPLKFAVVIQVLNLELIAVCV